LERHDIAQWRIRFHVEQGGVGARAVGKGRVCRLVFDALLADIDDPAVADALQIFFSRHEHGTESLDRLSERRRAGANDNEFPAGSKWKSTLSRAGGAVMAKPTESRAGAHG